MITSIVPQTLVVMADAIATLLATPLIFIGIFVVLFALDFIQIHVLTAEYSSGVSKEFQASNKKLNEDLLKWGLYILVGAPLIYIFTPDFVFEIFISIFGLITELLIGVASLVISFVVGVWEFIF